MLLVDEETEEVVDLFLASLGPVTLVWSVPLLGSVWGLGAGLGSILIGLIGVWGRLLIATFWSVDAGGTVWRGSVARVWTVWVVVIGIVVCGTVWTGLLSRRSVR